ncbi:hypothetical protein BJF78_17445 [Pseudonocardia sp. CNS-139]|nr:hypothetical protein BJF78_17445 [Pseudonocardia sp. CNS-139]
MTYGSRGIRMTQDPACAPDVVPGEQYDVSFWYKSDTAQFDIVFYRHDSVTGTWGFWEEPVISVTPSATYQQVTFTTSPVPADTDLLSWGPSLYGVGTVTTDDFTIAVADEEPPPTTEPPSSEEPTTEPVPTTDPEETTEPAEPTTDVPPTTEPPADPPADPANLNENASFEDVGPGGFPDCWQIGARASTPSPRAS